MKLKNEKGGFFFFLIFCIKLIFMKMRFLTAFCLSMVFSFFCSFFSFAYPLGDVTVFPELPETSQDYPYYVSYWNQLFKTHILFMFKEKPPYASISGEPVVTFLNSDKQFLNKWNGDFVEYSYDISSDSWRTFGSSGSGFASLDLRNFPLDEFHQSVYQNFGFDYSALPGVGFFPPAPFPLTQLSAVVAGAKMAVVLDQVVSLIPLLILFAVSLTAFWKGLTWLKNQLSGI